MTSSQESWLWMKWWLWRLLVPLIVVESSMPTSPWECDYKVKHRWLQVWVQISTHYDGHLSWSYVYWQTDNWPRQTKFYTVHQKGNMCFQFLPKSLHSLMKMTTCETRAHCKCVVFFIGLLFFWHISMLTDKTKIWTVARIERISFMKVLEQLLKCFINFISSSPPWMLQLGSKNFSLFIIILILVLLSNILYLLYFTIYKHSNSKLIVFVCICSFFLLFSVDTNLSIDSLVCSLVKEMCV